MAKLNFTSDEQPQVPGERESKERSGKRKRSKQVFDLGESGATADAKETTSLFKGQDEDTGPDYTRSKIRFRKSDEINPYADAQDERYAMDSRAKILIAMTVALVVVYFLACVLPTNVFDITRVDRTIGTLASETAYSMSEFLRFFTDTDSIFGSHMLTVFVSMVAGIAMAVSGGVFQGSMKNALASPSTLGVMSGGTVGAIIFAVFIYPENMSTGFVGTVSEYTQLQSERGFMAQFLETYGSFFCTLAGCLIIVFLVMAIAYAAGRGKVNNVSLVVAGQVFASSITVILSYARSWLSNHGDVTAANYLAQAQTTTFSGAYTLVNVLMFTIPVVLCLFFLFKSTPRINLLSFDEQEARSMGLSTTRTRNALVALCTILTALVVSFCGAVGFVGFLVPHMARKLVGPDFKYLLPACGLIGGILVTAVYYITTLGIPYISTGSTGVFTSLIGCIAFLVIAFRGRRSSGGEWL